MRPFLCALHKAVLESHLQNVIVSIHHFQVPNRLIITDIFPINQSAYVEFGEDSWNKTMANNEGEENTTRGNEWEVVQLTASTYAAAPGPKEAEHEVEDKVDAYTQDDAETSHALLMSRHFVFPPNQHENLPLEPDNSEILVKNVESVATELVVEEGDRSGGKDCDDGMFKGLDISKAFAEIPIFVNEGNKLPISGSEFGESARFQGLHTKDKEKSLYDASTYSSFHGEAEIGLQTTFGENLSIPDVNELLERNSDLPTEVSEPRNDDKWDMSELPSDQAWWKRTAASLYAQAKEGNTLWSVFIAAAVMGLVIFGQRWHQERLQVLQLKWQVSISNEKNGRILGPLYRLKNVFVGGHQRSSLIRGSLSSDS